MLSSDEQAAFLASIDNVQKRAADVLTQRVDGQSRLTFVRNLQAGVSQVSANADLTAPHLACRAGCHHCCGARVEVMAPEVFQIVARLRQLDSARLGELIERLRRRRIHAAPDSAALDAVAEVSVAEVSVAEVSADGTSPAASTWSRDQLCPLLENGLCSVYDVRPAVCRKGHSLDAQACATHAPQIPQKLELSLQAEALLRGTSQAYRQVGLDGAAYELTRALDQALRDPNSASRWLRGEAVFSDHD